MKEAPSAAARALFAALLFVSPTASARPQVKDSSAREPAALNNHVGVGNLDEQIPSEYRERYERWKAAFLSVDAGRRLWLKYAARFDFRLTVIVSKSMGHGARVRVDDYRWDGRKLVAATIVLGDQLNHGYPEQEDYPVLGSLARMGRGWDDSCDYALAAAKIAHEFGHVEQAANSDAAGYQLQNELSRAYAARYLSNGHNYDDPILSDLERRMGGTPMEINIEREYRAESCALRYLLDRLSPDKRGKLLKLVRKSLASSSGPYNLPYGAELMRLTYSD